MTLSLTLYEVLTMPVLAITLLLLAIGIGHSVQVTRRFMLENGASGNAKESAREAIRHTIVPATLSIVTDMVGFATLATVDISFYKAYAYFGMFGMLTLLAMYFHDILGMTDDTILAFCYRHERAARIYDGADEVHKISAAKQILKDYV